MDQGKILAACAMLVALLAVGCGTASDASGPDAVMAEFLQAVRQGDDAKASGLLTTLARQKTEEMEMVVSPPGSETASFKILEMEIEDDEAQVGTDWTDLGADGQSHTDRIVWMLRREEPGWRIHGMATRVFPDLAPIILNFEDPADMLRKQQQAEEEIARRETQTGAGGGESAGGEASTVR